MLKSLCRIFFIIFGIDMLVFITGYLTGINDTKPTFADTLYWLIKNVLSVPLSYVNRDYPFFLDSPFRPLIIFLVIVNNAILALGIWCIVNFVKKLLVNKPGN